MTDRRNNPERRLETLQAQLSKTRDLLERRTARYDKLLQALTDLETAQARKELHDGPSQTLTGLAFLLHSLAARLATLGLPEVQKAEEIAEISNQIIEQAKGLMRCLSLARPGWETLKQSLQELAGYTREVLGVPCTLECRPDLSAEVGHAGVHLLRIALDAVRLVVKSGLQERIRIELCAKEREVLVEVLGKSADASMVVAGDLKNSTMGLRADLIGATLSVVREAAGATAVRCSLPLSGSNPFLRAGPRPKPPAR